MFDHVKKGRLTTLGLLFIAVLTACGGSSSGSGSSGERFSEPTFETEMSVLNEGLVCNPFTESGPVVLLVHGTFTHGEEQWTWNYEPLLLGEGYDVCIVTYPNRGLSDAQIAAEYVVNAIDQIADSGRKVSIVGHSQGGMGPRWAVRWWPSLRDKIEDMILLATPNHGLEFAQLTALGLPMPAVFFQFGQESNYMQALNSDDETPGDIDYTNIYTQFDELVQPVSPVPTAALDWQQDNPRVANILIQDVCPGRIVEHATIGLTDRATYELVLDALANGGPASPERAGGEICGLLPFLPEPALSPSLLTDFIDVFTSEGGQGFPDLSLVTEEPPLKPYAQSAVQPE
ncbi:esterase/lipase family protein [Spongiibacter marinus]|uniref:esterase/lipase family protein n=1 Tax=Spongiibacter marinus TaxID=354246 RepID=UPI00196196F9|nr:alpha/beta fold hydrolase [Spongiibacter marinus]MBM7422389.1 pimeloyl-ACP methyl ester carboxylesterase [Spongiibacter marinus]